MPHYTATVNSYAEIRSQIVAACVAHGWTSLAGGEVVSKGDLVAELRIVTSEETTTDDGEGLHIQGGTGYDGELIEPSNAYPRIGPPNDHSSATLAQWPMEMDIHIFTDPVDEVYAILRHSVDYYWWMAFGQSSVALPGSGMWLSATSIGYRLRSSSGNGVTITPTGGAGSNGTNSSTGPFWRTYSNGGFRMDSSIHINLPDSSGWMGGLLPEGWGNIPKFLSPLLSQSPSAWNGEAALLPAQVFAARSEGKRSLVLDLQNARILRIDNYQPGQIITLGDDQWRVYPFYRKNADERDGGGSIDHSGTMGWAIRYDPDPEA